MQILFIFVGIIIFFIIALFIWNTYQKKQGNITREDEIEAVPRDGTCCGRHATCEKDSLINGFEEKVEYFDDEELDIYSGRPSDGYTPDEVDEFREVFYTMLDEDKPCWIRSLEKRAIAIPNEMKDEIILVINEQRLHKTK